MLRQIDPMAGDESRVNVDEIAWWWRVTKDWCNLATTQVGESPCVLCIVYRRIKFITETSFTTDILRKLGFLKYKFPYCTFKSVSKYVHLFPYNSTLCCFQC